MVILDNLGKCPRFGLKIKTKRRLLMEIECDFHFKFVRKPKTKKVTVVFEDEQ